MDSYGWTALASEVVLSSGRDGRVRAREIKWGGRRMPQCIIVGVTFVFPFFTLGFLSSLLFFCLSRFFCMGSALAFFFYFAITTSSTYAYLFTSTLLDSPPNPSILFLSVGSPTHPSFSLAWVPILYCPRH